MAAYAAPATAVLEVDGLAGLEERIKLRLEAQLGETTTIEIVAGGTRGGSKNALIARVQAAMERSPFYLNGRARQVLRFLLRGLTADAPSARASAAKAVGDVMLVSIGENVKAQRNPGGSSFRELTTGYALRKQRKHGFVKPILKATGDLLGGLRVRIRQGRGA